MGFWRIVLTIILPPLGVLLGKGFGWAFILNIILTILGYIPGLIHAFWVQTKNYRFSGCIHPRHGANRYDAGRSGQKGTGSL